MANQFYNHIGDLKLAFKFVILTSEIDNQDPVERLNKTFRNPETDENYTLFEKYMLGGLDELYENLILDTNMRYEDFLTRISGLIQNLKNDESSDTDNELNTDDFDF